MTMSGNEIQPADQHPKESPASLGLVGALAREALRSVSLFTENASPLYRQLEFLQGRKDLLDSVLPIAKSLSQNLALYVDPVMKQVQDMCSAGQLSGSLGIYAQNALATHRQLETLLSSSGMRTVLDANVAGRLTALLESSLTRELPRVFGLAILAQRAIDQIDFDLLASRIGLPIKPLNALRDSHLAFNSAYEAFSVELLTSESALPEPLQHALTLATDSRYMHVAILGQLSRGEDDDDVAAASVRAREEIATEAEDRVALLLQELDPGLLEPLNGARSRLRVPAADAVRQVSTSLRELLTHVLHRIAPDQEVRGWTTDPSLFGKDGGPTRRARLLYAMRAQRSGALTELVDKDVGAAIALSKALQEGTHGVPADIACSQLPALVVRTEVLLIQLLEAGRSESS